MRRAIVVAALLAGAAQAQEMDHAMAGHDMAGMDHDMKGMDHGAAKPADSAPPAATAMPDMPGMAAMAAMDMRDASGTAWQPASSPMEGAHFAAGGWRLMAHGFVTAIHDDQGGPRGGSKTFSTSMAMLMGSRDLGAADTLTLRGMVSLDPLMGKRGYPLLLATGETADGVRKLVDRQHPHDVLMELAAQWTHDLGVRTSLSLYAGMPGEPALGPPTYMHRVSGMANPEAPISHHWFDSTHVTFGVATVGVRTAKWKVEGSLFTGREPDQHRWDFDKPRFDSWSARLSYNPTDDLSLQVSRGHLKSPEQLHPGEDENRTTASATWNAAIGGEGRLATTLAWSAKDVEPGPTLHALLLESSLTVSDRDTVFARAERVREAELFEAPDPLAGARATVGKLSAGYVRTLPLHGPFKLALGGLASAYAYPDRLKPDYGRTGVKSFMLFARVRLAG